MIPKDKLLHIAAGALTGLSAFFIGWYALLVVMAVGIAKELWETGTLKYLHVVPKNTSIIKKEIRELDE